MTEPLDDVLIEFDVGVVMRDGVRLSADVYRPRNGRHPVLLQRTPYSKRNPTGLLAALDPLRAVRNGYAVVIQDVRGRYASEGVFEPFAQERSDGVDSVEWTESQPWSNERVGMFGSSYMAAAQLQAAAGAPSALRAICPIQGSADLREGRSYRGGAFEIGGLLSLALYFLGAGGVDRVADSSKDAVDLWNEARDLLDDLPNAVRKTRSEFGKTVLSKIAPYFLDWMDHPEPGPYWEARSVSSSYETVATPALHISSWYDQYLDGTLRNYTELSRRAATAEARENQYLLIGPWSHYPPRTATVGSLRVGDLDLGTRALTDLDAWQLRWFDRWLKDDLQAFSMQGKVRYFAIGPNRWRSSQSWPPSALTHEYFLGEQTTLTTSPPHCEHVIKLHHDPADPVPTLGGAHLVLDSVCRQGPLVQNMLTSRSDIAWFESPALESPMSLFEIALQGLRVASDAVEFDLSVRLVDVSPDGRAVGVTDTHRRLTGPTSGIAVNLALGPVAWEFPAGHRIALVFSPSSWPRFAPHPEAHTVCLKFGDSPPARLVARVAPSTA